MQDVISTQEWLTYTRDQPFSTTLGAYARVVEFWHRGNKGWEPKKSKSSPVLTGIAATARAYYLVINNSPLPQPLDWPTQEVARQRQLDHGLVEACVEWSIRSVPGLDRRGLTIAQSLDAAVAMGAARALLGERASIWGGQSRVQVLQQVHGVLRYWAGRKKTAAYWGDMLLSMTAVLRSGGMPPAVEAWIQAGTAGNLATLSQFVDEFVRTQTHLLDSADEHVP